MRGSSAAGRSGKPRAVRPVRVRPEFALVWRRAVGGEAAVRPVGLPAPIGTRCPRGPQVPLPGSGTALRFRPVGPSKPDLRFRFY